MMDQEQDFYKVCPECAGEYRPDVERCADCGVPLVHPEEIAFRDARELPLSGGLVALRTAPIAWVRALAQDLAGKAIPYGVDRRKARSEGLLTLYVRRQDQAMAKAVDEARARIEAPLVPEEEEAIEGPASGMPFGEEGVDYKVCLRCGGEYRLDAERCADCGGELMIPTVALQDLPESKAGLYFAGPRHLLPPSDDLVCVCCRPAKSLQSLSRKLDASGIAHRLEPAPYSGSVHDGCLYVLPADGDAAAAIDAERGLIPLEDVASAELTVCPACGTPHPLSALECSECGLGLGSETTVLDPACPRCGAVVGTGGARCPNCGTALPRA
jgi:ribosomal protein L40E